jgi:HD-like signal output (HDOD) protein
MLSADAGLAGRVVQAANSAIFAGKPQVSSVHHAVSRLGLGCVANIVTSITMSQLYQIDRDTEIRAHLLSIWHHSTRVAAISGILAERYANLDPYEAMLGGLIHNIGALPVVFHCAERPNIQQVPGLLNLLIQTVYCELGTWLLNQWNFPESLAMIPEHHGDLSREHSGSADYADVVTVANLLAHYGSTPPQDPVDWLGIGAFEKLKLDAESSIEVLQEAQSEITSLINMLN